MSTFLLIISYIIAIIHLILHPEKIPVHWDIHGNVNGWASYPWGILIAPVTITLIYFLIKYIRKIDPFIKGNSRKWLPILDILIILFISIQIITLLYVWIEPSYNLFPFLFSIFLIVFGNYLPVIPRNGFVGIRTPWTLSSDYVWNKTHRIAGYVTILTGIICFIFSFLPYPQIIFYLIIAWVAISTAISFFVWKKRPK